MITSANGISTLPTAVDAEAQVIGSCLIDPSLIAMTSKVLRPAAFFDAKHRVAWFTIVDMHHAGDPVDVLTVCQRLKSRMEFASQSPAVYLAEVGQECVTASNVAYHASLVVESDLKRRLHHAATDLATESLNGKAAADLLADFGAVVEDFRREKTGESRFKPVTAKELANGDYRVDWLIDFFLVEGQPCILAGGKKTLKTTLLCDLLLSLAIGCPLLGKFFVRSCRRVVFCSGESGLATLQETCRRIARAKGWDLADVPNFTITPDLPKLDCIEDLAAFELFLESLDAEVVAIDPIYLCLGDSVDATNLFKTGALLVRLSQISQRLGITIILAHHTRKHRSAELSTFDPPELEDVAFAGFQEFARQWVLLGRRDRYVAGSGQHRLWMNFGGSAGHSGLWALDANEGVTDGTEGRYWDVSLSKAADVRDEAEKRKVDQKAEQANQQIQDDRRAVCDVLAKYPDGISWTKALRDAKVSNRRWDVVRETMLDEGDVEACEITVSNQKKPKPGIKLATTEAA